MSESRFVYESDNFRKMVKLFQAQESTSFANEVVQIDHEIELAQIDYLSDHEKEMLDQLFIKANQAFNQNRPQNRLYFLNHAFVLEKLFDLSEINRLKWFLPPSLQSLYTIVEHETIWRDICQINHWPFHPCPKVLNLWYKNVVRIIERKWRSVLDRRQTTRLQIGEELAYIPSVGIKYFEAMKDFQEHTFICD